MRVRLSLTDAAPPIKGMQEAAMSLLDGVIPAGSIGNFNAKLTPTLPVM